MSTHTWDKPEINQIRTQNQAKQDDWPKETWKKCPNKWFKLPQGSDSPSESTVCLSTRTLLPPNKHFTCFTTFHLCVEMPLVLGGLVARIQHSHYQGLTSVSGWEPKPLQGEAIRDQFLIVSDSEVPLIILWLSVYTGNGRTYKISIRSWWIRRFFSPIQTHRPSEFYSQTPLRVGGSQI